MAAAEYMTFRHGKNVLVIDLDSQSNLTTAMVPGNDIRSLEQQKRTIYDLFEAALSQQPVQLKQYVASPPLIVSNVTRGGVSARLDMVISTTSLAQLDDKMLKLWESNKPPPSNLRAVLRNALRPLLPQYDAVIVDCPPGLNVFTSNAIVASDYFVSPAIPEPLSTRGINLIQRRVAELKSDDPSIRAQHAGTILNKVMHYRNTHKLEAGYLYGYQMGNAQAIPKQLYSVFDWWVPDAEALRKIGDYENDVLQKGKYPSLAHKYDASGALRNPAGGSILDRSSQEGQTYHLSERINRVVEELMTRTGI
jgi:chromosome partitioning protein